MTNQTTDSTAANTEQDDAASSDGHGTSRRAVLKAAGAGTTALALWPTVTGGADAVGIETPWLHRDGNKLKDPQGQAVTLRGVNIADPARLARNWRAKDAMDVFAKATNTDEGWYPRILRIPTQPQDISSVNNGLQMAHGDDWGPLLPGQFDESDLETYFSSYVDPLVEAAAETGLYVMIDYHRHFPIFHQPQHESDLGEYQCGNKSFEDDIGFCGERGVLWHSEAQASEIDGYAESHAAELHEELQLYWNFVAPRYADRSHVIYDIYNEPTGPYAGDWGSPTRIPHGGNDEGGDDVDVTDPRCQKFWDMWVERAQPWVDTVREHAPRNLITIGSPRWSQYTYWAPTNEFDGDNICYTGHVYTHESVRPLSTYYGEPAQEVPLFFSEFGWAEGGGKDNFDFLRGTADEYADEFETFIDEYPVHPLCWNFDHTWEPAFFKHSTSQDGSWEMWDYQARPGKWWREYLQAHKDEDLPGRGGGDSDTTPPTVPGNLASPAQFTAAVDLDWDASTDQGGSSVSHYIVSVDGSKDHEVAAGETETTVDGLSADTAYEFGVAAVDTKGNESAPATVTATTASDSGGDDGGNGQGLVVNDYDGDPAWSNHRNDLDQWCGAGSFQNGGGEVSNGALVLEYDNAGWFQEQVNQSVEAYSTLVLRFKGANGGEEDEFLLDIGGVRTMLSDLTEDSIGTSFSDITVNLDDAGVDKSSPGSVRFHFWHGGSSTLYLDEIRFE